MLDVQKAKLDKLTTHQWQALAILAIGALFEFFDNYIIAFVISFIAEPWELSYGASATVLLSSGVGGLIGSIAWGQIADRFGRKSAFAASLIVTAAASLALALTPEGNWIYLAVMRAVVGFGVGGFFVPIILIQEFVPASRKGFVSGILSTAAASGFVFGALSASTLAEILTWRGLFLLGTLPGLLAVLAFKVLPESPRWLLDKGRRDEAMASLEWAGKDPEADLAVTPAHSLPKARIHIRPLTVGILCNFGIVTAFYALAMWSPTLVAQVQGIEPGEAAKFMLIISVLGMLMRLTVGAVSDRFGRRPCGVVVGLAAALFVFLASLTANGNILTTQWFWVPLGIGFMFADASLTVLAAYTAEIFPSAARGRSAGISYAAGGVGKIIGPLGFALVMGSSNVIRPEATADAVIPAYGFVAFMFLLAAATYAFINPRVSEDTH